MRRETALQGAQHRKKEISTRPFCLFVPPPLSLCPLSYPLIYPTNPIGPILIPTLLPPLPLPLPSPRPSYLPPLLDTAFQFEQVRALRLDSVRMQTEKERHEHTEIVNIPNRTQQDLR